MSKANGPGAETSGVTPEPSTVRGAQMTALVRETPVNAVATITVTLAITAVLWPAAGVGWLLSWATAQISLSSFVCWRWWRRRGQRPVSGSARAFRHAKIWAFLSGAIWGASAGFLPFVSEPRQIALIIVVVSMAGGAATTLAALPAAAALYICGSVLPFVAYFVLQADPIYLGLALMALIMALAMLGSTRVVYGAVMQEIKARQERAALLAEFRDERDEWLEISGTSEGLALFDQQDRLLLWNEAYGKLLSLPAAALHRGAAHAELLRQATPPVDVEQGRIDLEDWIAARLRVDENGAPRATYPLANGTWLQTRSRRFANGHKATINVDVTDLKQTAAQLQQAQKMEAIGQLTGGVAHDFNNLLGLVIGHLDALDEAIDPDDRRRDHVSAALDAALRGSDLTHRLLTFSRRQPLHPEAVDVNVLISGMLPLVRRAVGPAIEIDARLAVRPLISICDRAQLETGLLNLALNARDAIAGDGRLTIETAAVDLDGAAAATRGGAAAAPGRYVMVAVSDTGAGMPREVVEQAFEPFFTTKEVGQGSGLGLSMVYGFVRQSDGDVSIDSEVGHGTTVRLYFPATDEAVLPAASKARAVTQGSGSGELLLVVEDDPDLRELAETMLLALGYRVVVAADAESGLGVLEARSEVALLFTDIMLIGPMNGIDLAVLATERYPGLRVVYTSGYTEQAPDLDGSVGGRLHFLAKPYRKAEMARVIRAALDEDISSAAVSADPGRQQCV